MAEYTRDIQQLQKTANTQPQFAPPSQSLGGDVVNLIGTGLDFYAKGKAQDELELRVAQEKAQKRQFSQGVMGYRDLRNELSLNPNISKTERLMKENAYIKQFSPELQVGIVKETNTLTGTNTNQALSEIDKRDEALKLQQEQTAQVGSSYAVGVLGLDASTVSTASEEQLQDWSKKAGVLDATLARQKEIMAVSDDITAPILESSRAVLNLKSESLLQRIKGAQQSGDIDGAKALGGEFRAMIMSAQINAPKEIKNLMEQSGKGIYYDAGLVSGYTKEIAGILNDPRVKSVLSGEDVAQENTNYVDLKVGAYLRESFFKNVESIQKGDATQRSIDDSKNVIEWFANKNISGVGSISSGVEGTLLRAMGGTPPPPPSNKGVVADNTKAGETEDLSYLVLDVVSTAINDTAGFLKKLDTPSVQEANKLTQEYITSKLDEGKPLSSADMNWIEESLTFGNTGDINKRGKGASKAMLQAPLQILARDDYDTAVKPSIDAARTNGVDPVGALTLSLENHIKNNVGNAFTELVNLGTAGTMGSKYTAVSRDNNRPSMQGTADYNLKDVIYLTQEGGVLKFKYKPTVLGQSTDAKKIYNLNNLNNALVVMNDYTKALSNVTGNDKEQVADEMMGLLNRYVSIPLKEDSSN